MPTQQITDAALAHPIISGLLVGVLMEAFTCLLRFGLGLRTADYRDLLLSLTLGVRVHHGYVGLVLLAAWAPSRLVSGSTPWINLALLMGLALFLSDAVHHAILKFHTGAAELA